MKRLPIVYARDLSGKQYWRSNGEREGTKEFRDSLPREFAEGAAEPPQGTSRRNFVALMGASAALAGLSGCRRPEEKIVPYARPPEEVVPGNPLYFATAIELYGTALGLIVESHEGRPTKVEGNPRHVESMGATDRYAQASVLDLYDPDRSDSPRERGEKRSWGEASDALRKIGSDLKAKRGRGLAVLTEAHRSPTLSAALSDLKEALPEAKVFRYEPFGSENARAGAEIAFGKRLEPVLDAMYAHTIVTLDADILAGEHSPVRGARSFAGGRKATEGGAEHAFNRLYAVESALSITGANADHRLRIKSGEVAAFAAALGRELGTTHKVALPASVVDAGAPAGSQLSPRAAQWVKAVAKDLAQARRGALVVAGRKQPPSVHALAYAINSALGSVGHTIHFFPVFDDSPDGPAAISDLAKAIRSKSVDTLLVLGGNPAFTAPADTEFASALASVPTTIAVGTHLDETNSAATWHINRAHYLESWGDARSQNGTYAVVQPLIAPLYGGKTEAEVVRTLLGDGRTAYELVRATFAASSGAPAIGVDKAFHRTLFEGFLKGSTYTPEPSPALRGDDIASAIRKTAAAPSGIEVTFEPDPHTHDGRYANNAWLQEWPDPLYEQTWGNSAALSRATAERLGIEEGDFVDVHVGNASLRLPALIAPGQADDSVRITAGFGRTKIGRVGTGVGVNTYPLRTSAAFDITGANVQKSASGKGVVARTQEHFLMEGRPLVREGTVAEFHKDPEFAKKLVEEATNASIWKNEFEYKGHRWGMAIDLNACTGCGVCMVACQAENNVPVVGVEQVLRTREMHWLRVDRYFEGEHDDARTVAQPMPCQQCENAPCESVCPVGATTHSPEGLNDMAYNRCIGTRYCLNNCPFKVRRFNFFNYHKEVPETEKMVFNPDVTVRSRGVMEKCTFCVQRINEAKIHAKRDGSTQIPDGTIRSACEQACPSQAIVFGDLNDPHSRVAELAEAPRAYKLLEELNIRPRVSYLAKLRNPNPELEST